MFFGTLLLCRWARGPGLLQELTVLPDPRDPGSWEVPGTKGGAFSCRELMMNQVSGLLGRHSDTLEIPLFSLLPISSPHLISYLLLLSSLLSSSSPVLLLSSLLLPSHLLSSPPSSPKILSSSHLSYHPLISSSSPLW